jgi:hypothetical protein
MPGKPNVGAGESDLTWNRMAGVSYAVGWGILSSIRIQCVAEQVPDEA